MSEQLYVKDGAIYKGSEKQDLKFGDPEQIRLLKKYAEAMEDAFNGGIPVNEEEEEVTVTNVELSFRCVCGTMCFYREDDIEGELIEDLISFMKCRKCNRRYNIERNDDGNLVAIPS